MHIEIMNAGATLGHAVLLVAVVYLVHGMASLNNACKYRGLERNKRKGETWPM